MLGVMSFGYKYNDRVAEAQLEVDCRVLRNPFGKTNLRPLTGEHPDVQAFVRSDPHFGSLFSETVGFIQQNCPVEQRFNDKLWIVAFGCLGGKHRSVAMALLVGGYFADKGWKVGGNHYALLRKESRI